MIELTSKIDHVVVMMFENRSFDSMLGFLYEDKNNVSPLGHPFEGLEKGMYNLDMKGNPVYIKKIDKEDPDAYHYPKKDPGEGFANTNAQLFGSYQKPFPKSDQLNQGFVKDFEKPIANGEFEYDEKHPGIHNTEPIKYVPDLPGVTAQDIMMMHTPETLPILSSLAKNYAVCDHWYCSAPTETLPNRAFTHMGTSMGYLYDEKHSYDAKSIFAHLVDHKKSWGIFGNNGKPFTVGFCKDIPTKLPEGCKVGDFHQFKEALKNNNLPDYTFLEPIWGHTGNSQHPNYNVAAGEQYLKEIYEALRGSGYWENTLLIITYDEHGGCYDHITPPANAVTPNADSKSEAFDFDFTRFGVRVPTVLISPWIEAGTVYRSETETPLDHTSILATLEKLFVMEPLTQRDAKAPNVLSVLSREKPRVDNPIKNIKAPQVIDDGRIVDHASQIQHAHANSLLEKHTETGKPITPPRFNSNQEAKDFIDRMHNKYYDY